MGKTLGADAERVRRKAVPLSPLLANVYLHYALDAKLWPVLQQSAGRVRFFRFADDFVVVAEDERSLRCSS